MAASRLAWAPALPGFNWTCTKLRNLGGAPARLGVSGVCPCRAEALVRKKMPAQREKKLAFMAYIPPQARMNRPKCREEYTSFRFAQAPKIYEAGGHHNAPATQRYARASNGVR